MKSFASARLRLLAAMLCALAMLPVATAAAVGAVAKTPRSCVVPMPCCERGFCPLHAHGANHHGKGPRWVRCDDEAPLLRMPAAGPLAVIARQLVVPTTRLADETRSGECVSPSTRAPEPELHPPESPAAS